MRSTIVFLLLFSLEAISLAADVTIYNRYNYDNPDPGTEPNPEAVSQFPWKFLYYWDDWVFVSIYWKNRSPSVSTMIVTYNTEFETFVVNNDTVRDGPRSGEEYYHFNFNKITEIEIKLNLYTSSILCSSLLVAKGMEGPKKSTEALSKTKSNGFTKLGFVLVVDLIDQCVENAERRPSHNNVAIYTYAIPSVIGMCVIILVIYKSVKKYCHRNSQPVATTEKNTHTNANEVVYADLGFVHEDGQAPGRDEESAYAQIIGVMKHPDGNV